MMSLPILLEEGIDRRPGHAFLFVGCQELSLEIVRLQWEKRAERLGKETGHFLTRRKPCRDKWLKLAIPIGDSLRFR